MVSTSGPSPDPSPERPSAPGVVGRARRERWFRAAILALLGLTLGWTLLAYGANTPAARTGLMALVAALSVALALRWLGGGGPTPGVVAADWSGPLSLPLLALAAWAALQLALPPSLASIDPAATRRALSLLAAAWVVHAAAVAVASAVQGGAAHLDRVLIALGTALALGGLASQTPEGRHLWPLAAEPSSIPFGPFWYRNHFAACLMLILPLALGQLAGALTSAHRRRRPRRTGSRLVSSLAAENLVALRRMLAPLVMLVGLIATTSRGAALALGAALAGAAWSLQGRSSRRVLLAALGVPIVAALAWSGSDSFLDRLVQTPADAAGRLAGWTAAAELARARPLTGWGLNAYRAAVEARPGLRDELERVHSHLTFAAHNDYLGLAAEAGLPGLALFAWAGVRALARSRHEPWRQAALVAGLLHAGLDFDIQQPALVLLFAAIAAPGPATASAPTQDDAS